MRYLKTGFLLFAFLYPVCLFSFPFFSEEMCPKLTASQMCRISSGSQKNLKPNHASKNLLRHTCHMTDDSTHPSNASAEIIFEGTSKGAICECHYLIPKGWNPPSGSSLFIIYARTISLSADTQRAMTCPTLQLKHYKTLVTGHTFEDGKSLLWRAQRSILSKLALLPSQSASRLSETPAFIAPIQKNIWAICRYTFNNFPITIQKQV